MLNISRIPGPRIAGSETEDAGFAEAIAAIPRNQAFKPEIDGCTSLRDAVDLGMRAGVEMAVAALREAGVPIPDHLKTGPEAQAIDEAVLTVGWSAVASMRNFNENTR